MFTPKQDGARNRGETSIFILARFMCIQETEPLKLKLKFCVVFHKGHLPMKVQIPKCVFVIFGFCKDFGTTVNNSPLNYLSGQSLVNKELTGILMDPAKIHGGVLLRL